MMDATTNLQNLQARGLSRSDEEALDFQRKKLREAAQGFEEMLLNSMYSEMFPSEDEGGFFGEGIGSGTYQDMFVKEMSRITAATGQLGLADMVEKHVAAKAGLTDESEKRTEPVPGTSLGRPLPIPLRRSGFNPTANGVVDPSLQRQALRRYNEARFSLESPVKGRVTSDFGERKDPFTGKSRQHYGMDIAAPSGTSVAAAANGTVKFSGWKQGYGNIVIIEHQGGYETRYAHNADLTVRKGDTVTAGQPIAKVGSTGRSTGAHLHFEVRKDGSPVNPDGYLTNN